MVDFFRGKHSWAKLARLIGQLVRRQGTALWCAMVDDDELIAQILKEQEQDDAPVSSTPPLEEFSPEGYQLANIQDRLAEISGLLVALGGGKPPRVRPVPRPRTAMDRAESRTQYNEYLGLVGEMAAAREREAQQTTQ